MSQLDGYGHHMNSVTCNHIRIRKMSRTIGYDTHLTHQVPSYLFGAQNIVIMSLPTIDQFKLM